MPPCMLACVPVQPSLPYLFICPSYQRQFLLQVMSGHGRPMPYLQSRLALGNRATHRGQHHVL